MPSDHGGRRWQSEFLATELFGRVVEPQGGVGGHRMEVAEGALNGRGVEEGACPARGEEPSHQVSATVDREGAVKPVADAHPPLDEALRPVPPRELGEVTPDEGSDCLQLHDRLAQGDRHPEVGGVWQSA